MNKPRDEAVKKALADLCEMKPFQAVMGWLVEERDRMDKANRIRGQENKDTAAYALTVILDEFHAARMNKSAQHTM